jgi:hypothetical protein
MLRAARPDGAKQIGRPPHCYFTHGSHSKPYPFVLQPPLLHPPFFILFSVAGAMRASVPAHWTRPLACVDATAADGGGDHTLLPPELLLASPPVVLLTLGRAPSPRRSLQFEGRASLAPTLRPPGIGVPCGWRVFPHRNPAQVQMKFVAVHLQHTWASISPSPL